MTTGPGRPVRAISNAVRTVASSLSGSVTRKMCLATEPMMEGTGASWNASVPMALRGTWPQITTIGMESAMQSRIGVTVLVAPGPDVTMAHADAAAGARVTRGHEARALLVGGHDERHLRLALLRAVFVEAEHGVVGRQDGAARVAENRGYTLVRQYLHDHLGAGHLLTGERMARWRARPACRRGHGHVILGGFAIGAGEPSSLQMSKVANRYSGRHARASHKSQETCVISSPSTCRTRPARSPASRACSRTRGYNIESLSVAATDDPSVSRVTLVTKGADGVILQIVNQLNKLIDVVAVEDLTRGEHIERELVVLKLRVEPQLIDSVRGYVVRAGGRVLEPSPEGFVVELTASKPRSTSSSPISGERTEHRRSGALRRARGRAATRGALHVVR